VVLPASPALLRVVVCWAVALYSSVIEVFLPTPRNCHYLFNMRDIAKVVQGIMQSDKKVCVRGSTSPLQGSGCGLGPICGVSRNAVCEGECAVGH
jgi:hypothetical protein